MNQVTLGSKVRDTATGYTGAVTCIAYYLSAETQCCVSALGAGGGNGINHEWLPLGRLAIVNEPA